MLQCCSSKGHHKSPLLSESRSYMCCNRGRRERLFSELGSGNGKEALENTGYAGNISTGPISFEDNVLRILSFAKLFQTRRLGRFRAPALQIELKAFPYGRDQWSVKG